MAPLRAPDWRRWSVASAAVVVGACLVGLKAAAAGELVVVAAAAVNVARGIRAHRPPDALAWWLAFGALLLFLAASGVDDLEQWLYAGHVPYPSASDPISLASYLMGIAAGLAFLRHRSRRADPTRLVDAGVVTAGVAALVWAMVVVPDLQDRASTLLARGTNVVFDVLALVLLAIVVRLAVGPGARNASWYWLATAVASLLASDLALVAWSTSQGSAPLEIVTTGLATWTCASVAAAAMHPSMVRLTEPLDEDISPMTMGRVGVMVGSALVVPAIVLLEGGTSTYLSTVGVVAAWAVMSALVVVRMAGLVRARERSARIESVVRHAGSRMVGASGPDEIYRAACDGAVAALAAEGAPSAWAVVGTVCGSELMVMSAGPDPRTPVAEGMKVSVPALVDALSAGRACALEPPTARGLPPALAAPWVGAFPVASKTAVEGVLVVGTGRTPGAAGFAGCESLARLLSLALDSSAAASLRHQKAAERRYRMLFEHAADLVAVIGRSGSVDFVSPSGSRLLGIDLQQHRIGDLRQLVHPDERSGYDRLIGEASIDGCPPVEARLRTATGWRWFDVVARDLRGVPDVAAIVVTARDITDRKLAEQRLAESERRFRSLVQSSTDIFATVEDGGRIRWASDSLHRVVGMAPGEVVGRDLASLVEEASREDVVHT
ncbi:MAG TPA: PAS domain S-box protein, partial [Acidimicrobiales bacterium]|nr:PAS domain S-box protein [Acidimicrobiales bacterium]